jgi:hypothetical protein
MSHPVPTPSTLSNKRPSTAKRSRFDDGRSPSLLENILHTGDQPRHVIILQLGSTLQFRWEGALPLDVAPGSSASALGMPPHVARDLPPGWIVTAIEPETDRSENRTVVRLGPATRTRAVA